MSLNYLGQTFNVTNLVESICYYTFKQIFIGKDKSLYYVCYIVDVIEKDYKNFCFEREKYKNYLLQFELINIFYNNI